MEYKSRNFIEGLFYYEEGLDMVNMEDLQRRLDKLWADFNNSTKKLKYVLEVGGKLEQTEVDLYNFTHIQIMNTRDEIKELNLEEKLDK